MAGDPPPDNVAPAAPIGLIAMQVGSQLAVSLDWAGNAEADWSRYKVYVSTVSGGPYDFVATPSVSTYAHAGRTNNTTYHYVVTAVDATGNESRRSNQASVILAAVSSVSVSGPGSLARDQTAQFTSTATLAEGSQQTVTTLATWASSNPNVVTVSNSGLVMAAGPGSASIQATYRSVTGSTTVTVSDPTPPTPPPPAGGNGIVINEFRVRGPQGGNDEFIELRNDSSSAIDVSEWSVLGSNSSGSTSVPGRDRHRAGLPLSPDELEHERVQWDPIGGHDLRRWRYGYRRDRAGGSRRQPRGPSRPQ